MHQTGFIQPIYIDNIKVPSSYLKEINKIKLLKGKEQHNNFDVKHDNPKFIKITDEILSPKFLEIGNGHGFKNYKIINMWVQKYLKGEHHSLHIHTPKTSIFSFIYFLKTTKDSASTFFYNVGHPYVSTEAIEVTAKTGKLIVFHSTIPHEVKANNDNVRTIVSGNIEYE